MSAKVKHLVFENEIGLIQDIDIQDWVQNTLEQVPASFWIAPASSSGKYHPACSNGKGGLIIHTKRAVWLADRICTAWGIAGLPRDIVLASCLLHDTAKDDYKNHAVSARKYFADWNEKEIMDRIDNCIRLHMGRWSNPEIKIPIEKYGLLELAVYTADYLSAMKELITPKDGG